MSAQAVTPPVALTTSKMVFVLIASWGKYLAMAFAQLTYRESLRDIEACLRSMSGKLYHMGFRSGWRAPPLADANESHDWRIFADFAQV